MGVQLESVVPWGRLLSEYMGMFDLKDADLKKSILDVGGGPASFNAEATTRGTNVISIDPIYQFTVAQIEQRIQETYDVMIREVKRNDHLFTWNVIKSAEDMGATRLKAMRHFLSDFPDGLKTGRYIIGGLPELPFDDQQFDLALCSNFLFLYSDKLTTDFHIQSIREMCRVAKEVRLFPLHDMANQPSVHVEPVTETLQQEGYDVLKVRVPYEFRHGSIYMLKVQHLKS